MSNPFDEKIKTIPLTEEHYGEFAVYMNSVKSAAVETEYYGAVEHELTRTYSNALAQLMAATDNEKIILLTGRLQGIVAFKDALHALWPTDIEAPAKGE